MPVCQTPYSLCCAHVTVSYSMHADIHNVVVVANTYVQHILAELHHVQRHSEAQPVPQPWCGPRYKQKYMQCNSGYSRLLWAGFTYFSVRKSSPKATKSHLICPHILWLVPIH